jgi:hypothetical protein
MVEWGSRIGRNSDIETTTAMNKVMKSGMAYTQDPSSLNKPLKGAGFTELSPSAGMCATALSMVVPLGSSPSRRWCGKN